MIPIVKDNIGDLASSDNYRAIAISSLVLKLFDLVIILLEGNKLTCDQLQFGFQEKSSTTMCTFAVTAVIDYYNRAGSTVYACAMDMSKAFDMVEWKSLFLELDKRDISPLIIRVLLQVYVDQYCDVRWNECFSDRFQVTNGVRQGAITSPIFYCIYCDELIKILRKKKIGCRIGSEFFGILVYADDIVLLSASCPGLQAMISECEKFALQRNLKFSTNEDPKKCKTKCIVFSKRAAERTGVIPMILNEMPLKWVPTIKHLGSILQENNSMEFDCDSKRCSFIGKIHSLSQEFHFVDPAVRMKLHKLYTESFYGSNLWNLFGINCEKIYRAYNISVRQTFQVPRDTHRYLIETISQCTRPKVFMSSRIVKFVNSMNNCHKISIRVLSKLYQNDLRTTLGKNMATISKLCDVPQNEQIQHEVLSTTRI